MPFVYKITNNLTSDFYIGKTELSVLDRFKRHVSNAKRDHDTFLYKAMRKYGYDNFVVDIVEESTLDTINDREIFFIKTLEPKYNMTAGGDGGSTTHNRMWVNNGLENKYILKESSIPDGYVKGRINCKFNDPSFQKEMNKRVDRSAIDYKEVSRKAMITRRINGTQRDISGNKNPTSDPVVREKIRQSALNRPIVRCNRCGKEGQSSPGMFRFHFENCKYDNNKS